MGESTKKLILMAMTASFCNIFPHLWLVDTPARMAALVFAFLNVIHHLIHFAIATKIKKMNFILGLVLIGIGISFGLADFISNVVFFAQHKVEDSQRTAMQLCCIESAIVLTIDGVCILIAVLSRREQKIRESVGAEAASQKSGKSGKSEKHSPERIADRGHGDVVEKTPKAKTPPKDEITDKKKRDDDSRKEKKTSDREKSRKDRSEKDRRDRKDDKSKSEKKTKEDRDKTKSGRSEKKDDKTKSAKDNSHSQKSKRGGSHRKKSSKSKEDRKKSDKEPRKRSSKKNGR